MGPLRALLGPLGRPDGLKQKREHDVVQEALLARLNPEWRDRKATSNALELANYVDFYFGIQ